ncbi:hypothetical protein ACXGQW_04480 [Wenyingzhuangia sp. IMCC45533]
MKILKFIFCFAFSSVLFTSCKNNSNSKSTNEGEQYAEEEYDYKDPYPEYCLVGRILDIDADKLNGDDAILKTEGRNRAGEVNTKITSFTVSLSNFDGLKEANISSLSLDVKLGLKPPKFEVGNFTLTPYSILTTEQKELPEVMVFLHDLDRSSSFEAVMQPDVEKIINSEIYQPDTYPAYIIAAASLEITHVEDMKLDEDELETQKIQAEMGMETGQQYVKGFVSFTIKKFGPKGKDFGPHTFTFASVNRWAYFPNL